MRQIFKIHLMNDSASRRHDLKVLKGLLPPFQKLKSFVVSFKLNFLVFQKGIFNPTYIRLHTMVNDQINRNKRIDFLRIFAQSGHSVSHGCEIYNGWDSSEVLEDHSRGFEGDFNVLGRSLFPV